ncbi:MAG: hypothetical protein ABI467_32140 [Kofleriaceae bacterium]
MRRARRHVPPDLTSLFDVLFIVIFAALIRAAAAQHALAAAEAPAKPAPPPPPLDPASLRARAAGEIAARATAIVRVSSAGLVTALEANGTSTPLDVPLLEPDTNPDIAVAYLGERSAELRVCRIAAVHLALPDLASWLVIIAPARPLADLPHALVDGLRRDVERCVTEQHGLAVIVEP